MLNYLKLFFKIYFYLIWVMLAAQDTKNSCQGRDFQAN